MKVAVTSDLHGRLPRFVPDVDLLLIAGDIAPCWGGDCVDRQLEWLDLEFRHWLENLNVNHVIATVGNHDWWGEQHAREVNLPWKLLIDEGTYYKGNYYWGCPWSLTFFDWAFMLDKRELEAVHNNMPECDVLLSHGPALGMGDLTQEGVHAGAWSLNKYIARVEPKLVVTGHIHEAAGIYPYYDSIIVNNSYLNRNYKLGLEPRIIEF